MLCLSLLLTTAYSCNKDDDPDGGNSGAGVIVDGTSIQLPYAYWFAESMGTYYHYLNVEFWSFDLYSGKVPQDYNFVSIYWRVPADQKELVSQTIAPEDYEVSAAFGLSSMGGWTGDSFSNNDYPLIIEKLDDNKFHIYIQEVWVGNDYHDKESGKIINIDYTGTLQPRPYVDE